jgi:hypothetical protein
LENLYENINITRAWGSITGNIKTSANESLVYYELKQQTVLKIIRTKEGG